MRRFQLFFAFIALALASSIAFQNCGTQPADNNPLYDDEASSTCVGVSCAQDPEAAQLMIANQEPLVFKRPTQTPAAGTCDNTNCMDVSGYCDVVGFPGSAIYTEIRGSENYPAQRAPSGCDGNGRFRVLVQLPTGFNYNNMYRLVVTLRPIDAQGVEWVNPSSIGPYRKEIAITSSSQ